MLLGVGSGGPVHDDAAFRAVGVPFAERGRRTGEALEVLTGLVEGRPTRLTGADVTLSPGAPMPPVLVGAGPERRAARSADEWHPAFSTPDEVRAGVERLAEPADAGVHRVLGMPFPSDRRRQAELLAEAARLAAVWRTEPAEAGRTRRWRVRPAGAP